MVCKKCGQQFEDSFNNCPNCGENVNGKKKDKKPIFKKWWFWFIIVIVVIGLIGSSGDNDNSDVSATAENGTTQEQQTNEVATEEISSTEAITENVDYRESCTSVGYKDIARMPDDYEGLDVYFTGQVIQVMESSFSNSVTYRIDVTKDAYGYWEDTVYVTYKLPEASPRIQHLDGESVAVYALPEESATTTESL